MGTGPEIDSQRIRPPYGGHERTFFLAGYVCIAVSILLFVGTYAFWYTIEESRECHMEGLDLVCTWLEDEYDLLLWCPIIGAILLIIGLGILLPVPRENQGDKRIKW